MLRGASLHAVVWSKATVLRQGSQKARSSGSSRTRRKMAGPTNDVRQGTTSGQQLPLSTANLGARSKGPPVTMLSAATQTGYASPVYKLSVWLHLVREIWSRSLRTARLHPPGRVSPASGLPLAIWLVRMRLAAFLVGGALGDRQTKNLVSPAHHRQHGRACRRQLRHRAV